MKSKKADKVRKALHPGERESHKTSMLDINGTKHRRRNANQYGKAEGGNDYVENRKNRSDVNLKKKLEGGGAIETVTTKDGVVVEKGTDKYKGHIFFDEDGGKYVCLGYNPKLEDCEYTNVQTGFTVVGCMTGFYFNDPTSTIAKVGASIPNNYEGKTPEQVWNGWKLKQREQFLLDHQDLIGTDHNKKALDSPYNLLPIYVKQVVEEHVEHGQYSKGGGINSGRDLLFKSKEPHEQSYDRKREWKEYGHEGHWFAKWFKEGGAVESGYTFRTDDVKEYNQAASPIMKFYRDGDEGGEERKTGYVLSWKHEQGGSGSRFYKTMSELEEAKAKMINKGENGVGVTKHNIPASPVEYFKVLNLSALPSKASSYIKAEILTDNDVALLEEDDEEFLAVKDLIAEDFATALIPEGFVEPKHEEPIETKPEPVKELTQVDYEKALKGAELMLEYAEGEEKVNLHKSIEGLKLVLESMLFFGGDIVAEDSEDENYEEQNDGNGYEYEVELSELNDQEKECMNGGTTVFCQYSPKELAKLHHFDCSFPNGDTFVLNKEKINVETGNKLKRGGSVSKNEDKNRLALKPGERESHKTSILDINGKKTRRRNANQYGKAEGGNDYVENRPNRSDKNKSKKLKRGGGMPPALNKWRDHLASVREANPGLNLSAAMKLASKSYTK